MNTLESHFPDEQEDATGWIFTDMIMNIVAVLILVAFAFSINMNPELIVRLSDLQKADRDRLKLGNTDETLFQLGSANLLGGDDYVLAPGDPVNKLGDNAYGLAYVAGFMDTQNLAQGDVVEVLGEGGESPYFGQEPDFGQLPGFGDDIDAGPDISQDDDVQELAHTKELAGVMGFVDTKNEAQANQTDLGEHEEQQPHTKELAGTMGFEDTQNLTQNNETDQLAHTRELAGVMGFAQHPNLNPGEQVEGTSPYFGEQPNIDELSGFADDVNVDPLEAEGNYPNLVGDEGINPGSDANGNEGVRKGAGRTKDDALFGMGYEGNDVPGNVIYSLTRPSLHTDVLNIHIDVLEDGRLSIEGKVYTLQAARRLVNEEAGDAQVHIQMSLHPNVPYASVSEVIDYVWEWTYATRMDLHLSDTEL